MKKIILILLFILLLVFPIMSKSIKMVIDNENIVLNIPDNTSDMEKQILEIFKAYIQTKNNFEKMKAIQEKTQEQLKETTDILDETIEYNDQLLDLIEKAPKSKITFFRPNIKLGLNYQPLEKSITGCLGVGILMFNYVDVGLIAEFPKPFSIGIFISIYLK